jgi:hypothetical protein
MDGHEAEAVGQLLLDEIEQVLGIQFGRVARLAGGLLEGLLERDVAHRPGGCGQHRPARGIQVAAGGQLHEHVGPSSSAATAFLTSRSMSQISDEVPMEALTLVLGPLPMPTTF